MDVFTENAAQASKSNVGINSVVESGGLFGVWGHPLANQVTYFGLHALQHRGQTSAGIVTSEANVFKGHLGNGLINYVFDQPETLAKLTGSNAVGQVRSATSDDLADDSNIQPLLFHFNDRSIAIAHTGNFTEGVTLRQKLEEQGAVFSSNSAAEILIHLIRRNKSDNFQEALEDGLKTLKGGYNFVLLTDDALYGAVDRHAFRPLVIGQFENGAYTLASETCALQSIGAKFVQELSAGQYVIINDEGFEIVQYLEDCHVAIEPMEFIYFSRPDSDIAGVNVHKARKDTGRRLAEEHPAPNAEMVIGVPNSSLSAASGYAEGHNLPYEIGLIKHQYTGRTFIEPTQELREAGVRAKLSVVESIIKGKSIVLVDDSIVRGTTIRHLITILREAGAREIHVRIASPAIRFPNYYGINTMHTSELVAANHTIAELQEMFDADSLGFISVDGLLEATNLPYDTENRGLSLDAYTGRYLDDIGGFRAEFDATLTPIQQAILEGTFVDE
ncbi:amidophosphoribosyltransferase [Aerococcus agrisoli]|uniref:amidophosphoribosyltransferase n=1 Tax=Aerococcus agrisoli TaxID=2487350 RepID=UPI001F18C370|nr:amidophosphoribosyltransferase [Aerococcus agrisoli]